MATPDPPMAEANDPPAPTATKAGEDEPGATPAEADPATPASPGPSAKTRSAWIAPDSRRRRLLFAAAIYIVSSVVFAAFAGPERLGQHTSFNHYALLADAWLHGRQDLAHGPPAYAMNNDFAEVHGKTYISFPPFPAVLMLPFVKLAGSPENFRDGQFIVWLAGIGPAVLFLALEKMRRSGRSPRTEIQNAVLAGLFAFGTVYFFTAVEGTVWFAAMVVGVGCQAIYLLCALDAERPWLAGAMMGCVFLSRPTMILAAPLFALEALRVHSAAFPPAGETLRERARSLWKNLDRLGLAESYVAFALPILAAFAFNGFLNHARYGTYSPFDPGHEYLTVAWRSRMIRWGVFGYHFLAKNLGIAFTSLPWLPPKDAPGQLGAAFKINEHGLALWFTTPLYLWLLYPKRFDGQADRKWLYTVVALSAALPAALDLLYQNSGWRQFGYRFSNDYSVLLFALLAVGARPMRRTFALAAAWGIAWCTFGAATFDRAAFDRFYFREGSQTVVYQPD
ncbi:MAG TPA: hypothetical protein VHV30_11010 [Polyangiaceae bacterium]|nr:hypothetical protein [Polyangiaceae bacterium]